MTKPIIICDDSNMARKQLARCLPPDWEVEVHFAEDGRHCLEICQEVDPYVIFLDLNMPDVDGYETLQEFNAQEMDYNVVVVSGDIQPDAQSRVIGLGAIDFIKKPTSKETLLSTLIKHGLYIEAKKTPPPDEQPGLIEKLDINDESVFLDAVQEVVNVAMGRAGDSLARYLDVFVELPVPKVNHIELSELVMALQFSDSDIKVSSVCQGFIGPELSGEALLIFNDSSFKDIAGLLKYSGKIDKQAELELLMDTANILIGACLRGIGEQTDVKLSQSIPVVLGQHIRVSDLIKNSKPWHKTLAIEINLSIENYSIDCDLLILFTDDCIASLRKKLSYLIE